MRDDTLLAESRYALPLPFLRLTGSGVLKNACLTTGCGLDATDHRAVEGASVGMGHFSASAEG